ncbi:DUF1700 domain-containing protein [Trinickia fusca]|uniref:DUF1700 domain-containing protein n=1 Tax=Trinickia fusca TaxID=2419777 RepID=A0A494X4J8_9BURK|nr:DUF1700 domain-containing protein [Trinickia fusca]RKP45272.1 DUF1700 domain-containing protein [Trinickia fusca]
MKQEAFIQQLRQALEGLPKHAVDEIVADYREYIGDALAAGRSEEDVIAALGDPAKLARELKAQASYRQWQQSRSFGNLAHVIVSIAGLGLRNVLLLVPFMLYLVVLTVGYAISSALTIAGLVAVVGLGSHYMFGWPALDSTPINVTTQGHRQSKNVAEAAGDALSAQSDIKDVKVVGDRLVLKLRDGSKASILTHSGTIVIKNEDGQNKVVALGSGVLDSLTKTDDGTYSIRTADVVVFKLKDDDDNSVSIVHGSNNSFIWDIRDDNADNGHVRFEQDAQGTPKNVTLDSGDESVSIDGANGLSVKSGDDSVVINGASGLSVNSGNQSVHIGGLKGATLAGIGFIYAVALLIGGVLGLSLCIWLTRATWRALARYVHRQIDAITARLDGREQQA